MTRLPYRFQYALRLRLVAGLARIWNALGLGHERLARHPRMGRELLIGQLPSIGRGNVQDAERPLRVTFFTMLGSHSYMTATDVALARALRARGHDVQLVLCDQALPVCENKTPHETGRWAEACHRCFAFGKALFDATGIRYHRLSDLARQAGTAEDASFLAASDHTFIVESSMLKGFRVGRLQGSAAEADFRRDVERACLTSARAALTIVRGRPDRIVMSHGVYSTWAPALDVFVRSGIPVAVYNKGKRRNSTVMNWVRGSMDWDVAAEWERVKDVPLTPEQRARIDTYLASRVRHAADALQYNFGDEESVDATWRRLRLDSSKPTFVLFTNVLWDAASAQKEIAFPNAVDWVLDTIDWFASRPDRQLVVKIHPAEVVIGTRQPFAAEIRRRFPDLPANVRLIEPHESVNSWSIGRIACAGLVHTSTPGMELPLEGTPCIVVSRTHYRGKGFTIDVDGRDEYFDLLDRWDLSTVERDRISRYAHRYAYLLFERYHLPWDFLGEATFGNYTAFNFRSDEELLRHPTIRTVIEGIEQQKDFLLPATTA